MVIPGAVFQVRAIKFSTVGALNRLINISCGFCDNRKILFSAMFSTFSSYVHREGSVNTINKKKYYFNWFHISEAYSLGQDLGRFRKPASQLILYAHIDRITDFCILVISEAIYQARAFKFGSSGALDTLIDINPGFCDNRQIWLFDAISSYAH